MPGRQFAVESGSRILEHSHIVLGCGLHRLSLGDLPVGRSFNAASNVETFAGQSGSILVLTGREFGLGEPEQSVRPPASSHTFERGFDEAYGLVTIGQLEHDAAQARFAPDPKQDAQAEVALHIPERRSCIWFGQAGATGLPQAAVNN